MPEGAEAEFDVTWGGKSYSVSVPEGVKPGESITLSLPTLEGGGEEQPDQAAVAVAGPESRTYHQLPQPTPF